MKTTYRILSLIFVTFASWAADPKVNGVSVVPNSRAVSAGTGLSGGGALTTDRTFTLDLSSQVNSVTLWDGSQATRTITYSLSGATDPVMTLGNNSADWTTGVLKVAGVSVRDASIITSGAFAAARIGSLDFIAMTYSSFLPLSAGGTGQSLAGAADGFLAMSGGSLGLTTSGATLTGLPAAQLTGTIPATVFQVGLNLTNTGATNFVLSITDTNNSNSLRLVGPLDIGTNYTILLNPNPSSAGMVVGTLTGTTNGYTNAPLYRTINVVFDGGGVAVPSGTKAYLSVPYGCVIQSATLVADQSGSAVIDVWKDTYANYPPTVGDTITASAKPTLSSAIKATDSTLTGWTTSITAGDVLGFNVDSATTVTWLTLQIKVAQTVFP